MWGDNIPENLIDMITYELLEDPVVAEDGHTYSRNTILDWFAGCREAGEPITSPMSRREIGESLRPDPQAARAVEAYKLNYKSQSGKGQKYNESTQTIGTLAKIFEIIDPLRDLFATKNWQAPALVVMGNENSGKSTLLERLAMMPIFPKDKFICTRMAIRVHLRRGPSMAPRLDVFDKQSGTVMWTKVVPMERGREFVREAMETVLMQEFGGLTGVSKTKMLILHITGPNCPNLDMVDLPGLVSTHVRGEPENMRFLTSDLVEAYVRDNNSNSLYLIAVPAVSAPNQSLAFEVVQKMGLHDRSIGVFTKSDKCDLKDESDGLGGLRDLRSKVYQQARDTVPLDQWGYVCTMNRPQDEGMSSNYSGLIKQSMEELQFFKERGMMDLVSGQMAGCRALLTRISVMFHDYLRSTWAPSTILLLKEEVEAVRLEERELGVPRADYFRPPNQSPLGDWEGFVTKDELIQMACDRAAGMLAEASSHTLDMMAANVLQRFYNVVVEESCELSGKPSEVVAHQILMKQRLTQAVHDAVQQIESLVVGQVAKVMSRDESEFKMARFPQFIQAACDMFIRSVEPWKDKTEAALLSYVTMAFQSPLSNPNFHLKYSFINDETGNVRPFVDMDFEAESLASTMAHTVVLRVSILLTECMGLSEELRHVAKSLDWIESCHERRTYISTCLNSVDQVVDDLMKHLNLTDEDMDSFLATGQVQSMENQLQTALANVSVHGGVMPQIYQGGVPMSPATYQAQRMNMNNNNNNNINPNNAYTSYAGNQQNQSQLSPPMQQQQQLQQQQQQQVYASSQPAYDYPPPPLPPMQQGNYGMSQAGQGYSPPPPPPQDYNLYTSRSPGQPMPMSPQQQQHMYASNIPPPQVPMSPNMGYPGQQLPPGQQGYMSQIPGQGIPPPNPNQQMQQQQYQSQYR